MRIHMPLNIRTDSGYILDCIHIFNMQCELRPFCDSKSHDIQNTCCILFASVEQ